MKEIAEFKDQILETFSEVIQKYSLEVNLIFQNRLILKNRHAELDFYMEFDKICCDLVLSFYDQPIPLIWIPIYGFDQEDFEKSKISNDFYTDGIAALNVIVEKYLHETFLFGNTHWLKNYQENEHLSTNSLVILRKLPENHPTKIKYLKGDITWLKDIRDSFPLINKNN